MSGALGALIQTTANVGVADARFTPGLCRQVVLSALGRSVERISVVTVERPCHASPRLVPRCSSPVHVTLA